VTGRLHVSLVVKGEPAAEGLPRGLFDGLVAMNGDGEVLVGEGELGLGTPLTQAVRALNVIRIAAPIFTSIFERIPSLSVTPWALGRIYPALPDRPIMRGPSAPATMHVSVIPTNNPCSATPVVTLIAIASPDGSSIPPSNMRSRIRLPLSVM
jgi:hypothetical protein